MGVNKELYRQIQEQIANDPSTMIDTLRAWVMTQRDNRPNIKG